MSVVCKNCGNNSEAGSKVCHVCGAELDASNRMVEKDKVTSVAVGVVKGGIIGTLIARIIPMVLIGIIFFVMGAFFIISDKIGTKGYSDTVGQLVDYTQCYYEDSSELCLGVYKYEVNGVEYTGNGNTFSSRSNLKKTTTIKYNPNNPSEYKISAGVSSVLFVGVLMIAFFATYIFIFVISIMRVKPRRKVDNI